MCCCLLISTFKTFNSINCANYLGMAFVNVTATSVKISRETVQDVDASKEESEQRNSCAAKEKSSSEIVSSAEVRESSQRKLYRQFRCDDKWWRKTVIYEIYVRSFFDSNNDGIGDLKGIEDKLDYFKELGVNTLWLTPMYPSPMVDFGYDISDFYGIDPIFGTMADFNKLLRKLKDAEMKMILDFVPNHTSDQHEWFKKSVLQQQPYSDYYVWKSPKGFDADGKPIPPTNWKSVFRGSAWEYNETRKQFYLHQFAKEQPDLNFRNSLVIQEMVNVLDFWLALGVDGFRLDAAPHLLEDALFRDNPPADKASLKGTCLTEDDYCFWNHVHTCNCPGVLDILKIFRGVCDRWSVKDGSERVLMTEGYLPLPELMEYYGTPLSPVAHFSFNFELLGLTKGCTASDVFACVTRWLDALPDHCWPNWQTGNHDQPRVASRLGEDLVDIMNVLLLLLPGTSVSYYGEEIGMKNVDITFDQTVDPAGRNTGPDRYQLFSRDPERSPMQWNSSNSTAGFSKYGTSWLPLGNDFRSVNVSKQKELDRSHLKTYKTLISLRASKAWLNGNVDIRTLCGGSVLAFTRIDNDASGESLLAVLNFSPMTAHVDISDFDHVPKGENAITVAAVTQLLEGYKEGSTVSTSDKVKLNGTSGIVFIFNVK